MIQNLKIIKDTYRALKVEKRFVDFTKSFKPLDLSTTRYYNVNLELPRYYLSLTFEHPFVPPFVYGILLIQDSLQIIRNSPVKITRKEVAETYVKFCVNRELKDKKILPNYLVYGFFYGDIVSIIGIILFSSLMTYLISPYFAFVILLIMRIYLKGLKNYIEIL